MLPLFLYKGTKVFFLLHRMTNLIDWYKSWQCWYFLVFVCVCDMSDAFLYKKNLLEKNYFLLFSILTITLAHQKEGVTLFWDLNNLIGIFMYKNTITTNWIEHQSTWIR